MRGFTLVELLIVVAIIGVLSTIGVPTYRRMIQKSKQAEAKLHLGSILKAQQGFRAEFDVYGNNLKAMGFEIEGMTDESGFYRHPGRFAVGMPGGSGGVSTCGWIPYHAPGAAQAPHLYARLPSYGVDFVSAYVPTEHNLATTFCYPSDIPLDGSFFIASASGVIAPGPDPVSATPEQFDVWTIDDKRVLQNVQSGVQ